jgi:uncharacterized protein
MTLLFADTGYWIALLDPQDSLNGKAKALSRAHFQATVMTSEMVLTEVLNHFSKRGRGLRIAALMLVNSLRDSPSIEVLPQTPELFQQALQLYSQRLDQAWSHTDCASFVIMQQRGIVEALAYDKHFEQAGFRALMRLA